MFHMTLLGDAKALLTASEGFELNAIHFEFPESQARCAKTFAELTQHTSDLEKTLLEQRPNVQRWSLAQADRLALSIKGILGCIKNLIDYNENDVIVVVNQNLTLCSKACDALEQAKAHIPKHKSNLTAVTDALKDQVSNRATVVKDTRVVDALNNLRRRLDPAVENCLNRGTTNDFTTLRELLREAGKLFVPQFSEGDFAYKVRTYRRSCCNHLHFLNQDVDSKAFNSAIDDLLGAIRSGEGAGIRENAGRLGAQAKALDDAGAKLKEQTKALVAAAAEALKNKDSEEAQKRLEDLMRQAKKQAEELEVGRMVRFDFFFFTLFFQAQQKREAERRNQLLKASAGLGIAIDHMQGNLASYRDAVKHDKISAGLERDMDREEQDRIAKLRK
jgi:hypothetical protein